MLSFLTIKVKQSETSNLSWALQLVQQKNCHLHNHKNRLLSLNDKVCEIHLQHNSGNSGNFSLFFFCSPLIIFFPPLTSEALEISETRSSLVSMIQKDWVPFWRTQAGYKCYMLDGNRSVWSGKGTTKVYVGLFYHYSSKKFINEYKLIQILSGWQ